MDKKTLKKYKPNKDRVIRIENQMQELCEREPTVVMGKVTGSSADFPYTEVRTSVQMYDPYEDENVRQQIRRKEADRLRILKEQEEVEDYINGIDDPEIKEIFELHYLEGKTQQKVADEIGYTQARVSQIISGQLKRFIAFIFYLCYNYSRTIIYCSKTIFPNIQNAAGLLPFLVWRCFYAVVSWTSGFEPRARFSSISW